MLQVLQHIYIRASINFFLTVCGTVVFLCYWTTWLHTSVSLGCQWSLWWFASCPYSDQPLHLRTTLQGLLWPTHLTITSWFLSKLPILLASNNSKNRLFTCCSHSMSGAVIMRYHFYSLHLSVVLMLLLIGVWLTHHIPKAHHLLSHFEDTIQICL